MVLKNSLNQANTALSWARMALKPAKSRCFVLTDGKFQEDMTLYVSKSNIVLSIPSISNQQVKFLGRTISSAVCKGLALIDKSFHRGVHKVWILQHLLVPRLCWPLLIYEIPISVVLHLEQKISCYMQKWLNLHNSTTNICLYSSVSPCHLPIKSLTSVMKSAKVSGHLLLRKSSDQCVSGTNIDLKSGKWKVPDAVREAESTLEFKKIIGYISQTEQVSVRSQPLKYLPNGLMLIENCFPQLYRKLTKRSCRQKLLS